MRVFDTSQSYIVRHGAPAGGASLQRPSWLAPVAISAALTAALLTLDPHTRDLANQVFRAELFDRTGLSIWNGSWYGGHYLLSYSVLVPPLAALIGVSVLGAVSVVASAYLFDRLVRSYWGEGTRWATVWYAVGAVTMLASGRIAFAAGVAVGMAALRALQLGRTRLAAAAALVCSLASPVAGVFLAGGLAVVAATGRERRAIAPLCGAVAALVPVALLNLVFPEGGHEPFAFSAFVAVPLWCAGALYVTRGVHEERSLRALIAAYLCATIAVWLLANPLGGNVTRLGALLGGPVLAAVVLSRRTRGPALLVALLLAGSLYWQLQSAVRDVVQSTGDPSTHARYYDPLADWLRGHGGDQTRIEIVPTSNHWETAYLSPDFQLVRGWLRQLDRDRNRLFYEGHLTHGRYRQWLRENAVRYVALPNARLDYSAKPEQRLLASRPGYLRQRAVLRDWRVFELRDRPALVRGGGGARARLAALGPQSFTLRVSRPGRFVVRMRASPFWRVTAGQGCVGQAGRWLLVRADGVGRIRVAMAFSLSRALRAAARSRSRC